MMNENFDIYLEQTKPNITNEDIAGDQAVNTARDVSVYNQLSKTLSGNIDDVYDFFEGNLDVNIHNRNSMRTYYYKQILSTPKAIPMNASVNSDDNSSTLVPVNALDLGVLFEQRVQKLPLQPVLDGSMNYKGEDKPLEMKDLIDEVADEKRNEVLSFTDKAHFASQVRWQEVMPENFQKEDESYISNAKDQINYKRSRLKYGILEHNYSTVNKYLKLISRNTLEERFNSVININAKEPQFERLLKIALKQEEEQARILRLGYTLKQLLTSDRLDVATASNNQNQSYAEKLMRKLFLSNGQYLSFVQMAQEQNRTFFVNTFLPNLRMCLNSMKGMMPSRAWRFFVDDESYQALTKTHINKGDFVNGTGSMYYIKDGDTMLSAIVKAADDNGIKLKFVRLDGMNSTQNYACVLNPYAEYAATFSGATRSYMLMADGIATQMDLILPGVLPSYGEASVVKDLGDLRNYTQNSPFDFDISYINTFTNVLFPKFNLGGNDFSLFMRFDFAQ